MKSTVAVAETAAMTSSHKDASNSTIKDHKEMSIASMISSLEDSTTADDESTHNMTKKTTRRKRRLFHHDLVLHFDINETILVGDEAGGDSREDCINKMLAKSAFVRMTTTTTTTTTTTPYSSCSVESTFNMEPTLWWDGTPIVVQDDSFNSKATQSTSTKPTQPPPLYIGWQWPSNCCPYYRTKYKKRSKTFTERNNHGSIYRPTYELLDETLKNFQQHVVDAAAAAVSSKNATVAITLVVQQEEVSSEPKSVRSGQQEQRPSAETLNVLSHMLPSFFETLVQLSNEFDENHPGNDDDNGNSNTHHHCPHHHHRRRLTLVFRTMGTDLFKIAQAVNAFAQGQHPDYPNFYNPNFILSPNQIVKGRWKEIDDSTTTTTTSTSAATTSERKHDTNTEKATIPNVVYQLYKYKDRDDDDDNDDISNCSHHDNDLLIASGDGEVLDFIHSHTICGIQDDYPFWKRHGQEPFAGKPVWKIVSNSTCNDPTSLSSASPNHQLHHYLRHNDLIQHILLDDNIHNLPHDSIASVRQVVVDEMATRRDDVLRSCNDTNSDYNVNVKESSTSTTTSNNKRLILGVESLTGPEIQAQHGVHLIRVPTVAPLLDTTWFMKQIHQAQEAFAQLYYPDVDEDDETNVR